MLQVQVHEKAIDTCVGARYWDKADERGTKGLAFRGRPRMEGSDVNGNRCAARPWGCVV